jgi:hypothetical protein
VARGIAGVLLAERFDAVVTDLGAGPEFTEMAVGGLLNPAEACVVLTNGARVADLTADRVELACRRRKVPALRVSVEPAAVATAARSLADRLVSRSGQTM